MEEINLTFDECIEYIDGIDIIINDDSIDFFVLFKNEMEVEEC